MSKTKKWYETKFNEAGIPFDEVTEETLKLFESMFQNALTNVEDFYKEKYEDGVIGIIKKDTALETINKVRKEFANLKQNV